MWRVGPVCFHIYDAQRFIHTFPDLIRRYADILRTEGYVFFHNGCHDLVVRVLEYHPYLLAYHPQVIFFHCIHAVDFYTAFRWQQQRVQMTGKGTFPASVCADDSHKLSRHNLQIYLFKSCYPVVIRICIYMFQPFHLNDRLHKFPPAVIGSVQEITHL